MTALLLGAACLSAAIIYRRLSGPRRALRRRLDAVRMIDGAEGL